MKKVILLVLFVVMLSLLGCSSQGRAEIKQMQDLGFKAEQISNADIGGSSSYYFRGLWTPKNNSGIFVSPAHFYIEGECSDLLINANLRFGKICRNIKDYSGQGNFVSDWEQSINGVTRPPKIVDSLRFPPGYYFGKNLKLDAEAFAMRKIVELGGSVDKVNTFIFTNPLTLSKNNVIFSGFVVNLNFSNESGIAATIKHSEEPPYGGECDTETRSNCTSLEGFTGFVSLEIEK